MVPESKPAKWLAAASHPEDSLQGHVYSGSARDIVNAHTTGARRGASKCTGSDRWRLLEVRRLDRPKEGERRNVKALDSLAVECAYFAGYCPFPAGLRGAGFGAGAVGCAGNRPAERDVGPAAEDYYLSHHHPHPGPVSAGDQRDDDPVGVAHRHRFPCERMDSCIVGRGGAGPGGHRGPCGLEEGVSGRLRHREQKRGCRKMGIVPKTGMPPPSQLATRISSRKTRRSISSSFGALPSTCCRKASLISV